MKKVIIYSAVAVCFLWHISAAAQSVSFSEAVPVWISKRQVDKNFTASFRAVIRGDNASDATFRLTASCDYRAWVNGKFLGHGPCVAGVGFFRVDEYRIGAMLKPGDNIVAIEVAGYNTDNYYLLNQPSFLQAEIVSGGKVLAATASRQPVIGEKTAMFEAAALGQRIQDVPRYSFQRPHTEVYKLAPSYNAWMTDTQAEFKQAPL